MERYNLYDHTQLTRNLDTIPDDLGKIDFIIDFIWNNFDILPAKCKELADWAARRSHELEYKRGIAYVLLTSAYQEMNAGLQEGTQKDIHVALDYFLEVDDAVGMSRAFNMIAYAEWWKGNYDKAVETALRALKESERSGEKLSIGWANYAMGVFYNDLKDFRQAIGHFEIAIACAVEAKERFIHARATGALGTVYLVKNEWDQATELIVSALEKYRALNYPSGIARALNDLSIIEKNKLNYKKAEELLLEALNIRKTNSLYQGWATTLNELAALYLLMKDFDKAKPILLEAVELCEKLKAKPKMTVAHRQYYEFYRLTGEPWKALEHLEIANSLKEAVSGEQQQNKIKQLQTTFATEKAEKEKEIERLRNIELKEAYDLIEQKNKDITDSINYARRIQQAILPSVEETSRILPDSFFLYIPREVVSGDFYWCAEVDDKIFVAAVDCTGHGVPGAFMSMIGTTLLNEIVSEKKITQPAEVLNLLREGVIKSLRQTGAEGESSDGMDISIVRICRGKGKYLTLSYAGANNPAWIIRNRKLIELLPDKQPIGVYHGSPRPFEEKYFELEQGDLLYLFTDGYADQFGGEEYGKRGGKKFKYARLKEQLIALADEPIAGQSGKLREIFEKWKGGLEQTDDVLLIGIRV